MKIESIPIISVSYNSPELIGDLLRSVRQFYCNPVTVIDGSNPQKASEVADVCAHYQNVRFIHFDYNIHHGPGMAWAFQNLPLEGPVLVLDSDLQILRPGMIESMAQELKPRMYGVGHVGVVDEDGFDLKPTDQGVRYLHPACMLCNVDVVREWPLPVKHGAPLTPAMLAIHRAGRHELIGGLSWLTDDFQPEFSPKHFVKHDWQGTVLREGTYHLNEWQQRVVQKRTQQPPKSEGHISQDLLTLIPEGTRRFVEVVGSQPSLASFYDPVGVLSDWTIVDATSLACASMDEFAAYGSNEVWVMPGVLECVSNPWEVLSRIRGVLPERGCVIASIANAQYWPILVKLLAGDFRYESGGLTDIDRLRWFTRSSMLDLFTRSGFKIDGGFARIGAPVGNDSLAMVIRQLATIVGFDDELALQDCRSSHFVVRAVAA